MCNCHPDVTSADNGETIAFDPPAHMKGYGQRRKQAGLSGKIVIDACMADEIKALWYAGITTYGCCCGHNRLLPSVAVDMKDVEAMNALGYERYPSEYLTQDRPDIFTARFTLWFAH